MQVILTSRSAKITSKKGWVGYILHGLKEDGQTITLPIGEKDAQRFNVEKLPVLDVETLQSLFNENPRVEIEYGERGFVADMRAA